MGVPDLNFIYSMLQVTIYYLASQLNAQKTWKQHIRAIWLKKKYKKIFREKRICEIKVVNLIQMF